MVELTVSMHLQQFEDLKLQKCSGGVFFPDCPKTLRSLHGLYANVQVLEVCTPNYRKSSFSAMKTHRNPCYAG